MVLYGSGRRCADRLQHELRDPTALNASGKSLHCLSDAMSVTGFTPDAVTPSTVETSSGEINPAAPARKAPRLAAGSCASNALERESSAELVRRLADGTPPSAEGGPQATDVASPVGSSGETDSTDTDLQVPARCGGSPRRATADQESTWQANTAKQEANHTASALGPVPRMAGESTPPEYLNVPSLSPKGEAQEGGLSMEQTKGSTANRGGVATLGLPNRHVGL